MSDGNCQGGAPRPCFAPLRSDPRFDHDPLNITINSNGQSSVKWPYEGVDKLKVVCVTDGDQVSSEDGTKTSSEWAGVAVPVETPYLSEESVSAINSGSLNVHKLEANQALVFTPAIWTVEAEEISSLQAC